MTLWLRVNMRRYEAYDAGGVMASTMEGGDGLHGGQ